MIFSSVFLAKAKPPLPLLSFQITLPNSHNAHTVCACALHRSVYLMIFYLFISALFLVNLTFTSITFRLVDQVKSNCVCSVNNATTRMLENVIKSCVVFWSGTHFHFLIVCCVIISIRPVSTIVTAKRNVHFYYLDFDLPEAESETLFQLYTCGSSWCLWSLLMHLYTAVGKTEINAWKVKYKWKGSEQEMNKFISTVDSTAILRLSRAGLWLWNCNTLTCIYKIKFWFKVMISYNQLHIYIYEFMYERLSNVEIVKEELGVCNFISQRFKRLFSFNLDYLKWYHT